jgi:hypothetical protein
MAFMPVMAEIGELARMLETILPGKAVSHGGLTVVPVLAPEALSSCPVETAPAVGLGTEYRLTGARMTGAVLVSDDHVAHLMAFPGAAAR